MSDVKPSNNDNLPRLMDEGRRMIRFESDDPPETRDIVWRLLQEATETMRTISPPGPQRPGTSMPDYWHTSSEIWATELAMIDDNISYRADDRVPASAAAMSRFEAAMNMLRFIRARNAPRTRKTLLLCASGRMSYDRIAEIMGYPNRNAVDAARHRALNMISDKIDTLWKTGEKSN